MMNKIEHLTSLKTIRVDFRKQLEFLIRHLDERQTLTGATDFSIDSSDYSFRHLIATTFDETFQIAMPGTTGPETKILLPLFLEINGELDVRGLSVSSDPRYPTDVHIRYGVTRPSIINAFHVATQGLSPESRAKLNEHELKAYDRVYRRLASRFVFGGKLKLERSFAELSTWIIRKLAYCLEEPSFLREKAIEWLNSHEGDTYLQLEDRFFLPFLYERLRDEFGDRVVKKPERFGGEIDLLFDDTIPIELKVREGYEHPLADAAVDARYPGRGQAAAYASISRLGLVTVLDLPSGNTAITNLDNCVSVVERTFEDETGLPTCVAAFTFHCHHPKPSSVS